ncbi:MAG: 5-formyltetrahydrofolate cyclo-ligase [Croceitalea sp.]|nr:5-formyltetrahydrofolate cyclo-ligase [Croceitalea sp.]
MLKSELRLAYLEKRTLLSSENIDNLSLKIANALLGMPIWHYSYYHIFLSIAKNKEVDINAVMAILHGKDKHIVVPKVTSKNRLNHFLLTDATVLMPNTLNIPEPVEGIEIPEIKIDVVFVPLLAFDKLGNRVGYGKGFYDCFLQKCTPETIKIGLSFFEPVDKIEDTHEGDVKLDYCVNPDRVYQF